MRFREGEDGIERTPQYFDFMTQLQQFHDSLGTALQQEPILGGKKLDLYRIYLGVKNAGGFEKVSEEHGWQKIANPFEFPPTCTNSAYVIKRAYRSYLYNYAQVKDYGTPIEALKVLETTTRKLNEEGTSSGKKSGKAKFQDVTPVTVTFVAPQRGNGAPIRVEEYARDDKYLSGLHQNKLLLALQSGLPNEIDWAFNKLVRLSSTAPPNFSLGHIPGLMDVLLSHTDSFFDVLKLNTNADNFETSPDYSRPDQLTNLPHFSELTLFNPPEPSTILIERVLQLLHIIRNFSFTEINLKFLISQHLVLTIIAKALALPSYSVYTSLKHHALDIFENLSGYITLRGRNDFYLACVRKIIIDSTDRGLLLGSLRSLARLCGTDANHSCLVDLDPHVLERAFQLLRVTNDDELVYVVLEFFYMYSNLGADAIGRIVGGGVAGGGSGNVVGLLIGYLHLKRVENVGNFGRGGRRKVVQYPPQQQQQQQGMGQQPQQQQHQPITMGLQPQQQPQKQAAATPMRSTAASQANSAASSPAMPKGNRPIKQTAAASLAASPMTPSKKPHLKDEDDEDEEIDIDGDDDDDYQTPAPKSKQQQQYSFKQQSTPMAAQAAPPAVTNNNSLIQVPTTAAGTALATAFMDILNAAKKRGRPPKYKAEIDAYSAQLALSMQQQQQVLLSQNPGMSMQDQQTMMMQYAQQHSMMVSQFMAQLNAADGRGVGAAAAVAASAGVVIANVGVVGGGGLGPGVVSAGGVGGTVGYSEFPASSGAVGGGSVPVGYGGASVSVQNGGGYEEEVEEEEEEEEEVPVEPSFECHWREPSGKECPLKFGSEEAILKHLNTHFSLQLQQSTGFVCRWGSCTAFHAPGKAGTRSAVFRHARTHIGDSTKKPSRGNNTNVPLHKKPFKSGSMEGPDLIGIPLTAILVLRNLARVPRARDLFLPFEGDLVTAMAERPKLCKSLAELMYELR
ncbi:UNVERIFIED_CONTAM: AT-rich interactive domain-containing protein 2 [Siphonaria sp. JEL0065]|nr:AT-rich interactive domain-containing protein 2 [Siphonaria sp. JEL0065]